MQLTADNRSSERNSPFLTFCSIELVQMTPKLIENDLPLRSVSVDFAEIKRPGDERRIQKVELNVLSTRVLKHS